MSLLVVGTLCIDTIETPAGRADRVLGGSAAYASTAAALFTSVRLVAPIGDDFPRQFWEFLAGRGIDLTGVDRLAGMRSQFWHGRYHPGLRLRDHVAVDLDILDRWEPRLPESFRHGRSVFLAHMPPHLQLAALDQLRRPDFVMADTIDYWIQTRRAELEQVLRRVDAFVLNDQEARLLTGEDDVRRMGPAIRRMGPRFAVIKSGEAGSYLDGADGSYRVKGYPAERVIDTTGAGDTFAGSLMGHLHGTAQRDLAALARSAVYGSAVASFTVEDFGLAGLARTTRAAVEERIARHAEPATLPVIPARDCD